MNNTKSNEIKALVVDDNSINREILVRLLNSFHIKTDQEGNGAGALQLMQKNSYDLVMLDYYMPGMKGTEVLREFRKKNPFAVEKKTMLILGITAEANEAVTEEYKEAGAGGVIGKPIQTKELEGILKNHFADRLKKNDSFIRDNDMEQIAQKSILEIAKSMEELLIYTRTAVFAEEERKRLHIAIHSIKGLLSEDEKRQMKNAILLLTKISAEEPVSKEEVKPFLYDCIAYAEQKTKNLRREPEHFLPAISSEEQQNHEKKALLALRIFDYCTAKSELTFLYESARERNREVLQKAIEALENYDYSEAEEMISQLSGNKNTSV